MELEFMELKFQNATIGLLELVWGNHTYKKNLQENAATGL